MNIVVIVRKVNLIQGAKIDVSLNKSFEIFDLFNFQKI